MTCNLLYVNLTLCVILTVINVNNPEQTLFLVHIYTEILRFLIYFANNALNLEYK